MGISLEEIVISIIPILLSLTIHEFSHGYAAYLCGDDTARLNGRLTLNPLAHLDPIGTIVFFIAHIGWAKPVPVNPRFFRNPRRDEIIVSAAGPGSNIVLGVAAALVIRFLFPPLLAAGVSLEGFAGIILYMLKLLVLFNFILAIFNLIPIFPLDGSHILQMLLPPKQEEIYNRHRPFGWIIILVLVFSGALDGVIFGPAKYMLHLLAG